MMQDIGDSRFTWDMSTMMCTESFDIMTTNLNPTTEVQVGPVITTTMNKEATPD